MELQIIQSKIHTLRGQRVMLDFDLAALYETPTKLLKQAVRRNIDRFPEDFMFELTLDELQNLRSQIVTSSWGGIRYKPFAFTEHGVTMLSSILNSSKAIQVNIAVIRAFIDLRRFAMSYTELAEKMKDMERRIEKELADVNDVLKWLGEENQARHVEIESLKNKDDAPEPDEWANRQRIGFKTGQ
jgi:phage regulator Rha-like protein